jgi:hypothetical protein
LNRAKESIWIAFFFDIETSSAQTFKGSHEELGQHNGWTAPKEVGGPSSAACRGRGPAPRTGQNIPGRKWGSEIRINWSGQEASVLWKWHCEELSQSRCSSRGPSGTRDVHFCILRSS